MSERVAGYIMGETDKAYICLGRFAMDRQAWVDEIKRLEDTGRYDRVFRVVEEGVEA